MPNDVGLIYYFNFILCFTSISISAAVSKLCSYLFDFQGKFGFIFEGAMHIFINYIPFYLYRVEGPSCSGTKRLRCLFGIIEERSDALC